MNRPPHSGHDPLRLFAAYEKDGGAFIGWFCLRPEPDGPLDEAELGYRLRQARRSRNVMEKLEMTLADTLSTPPDMQMVEGAEHGGVRYEITKEQWEQRQ